MVDAYKCQDCGEVVAQLGSCPSCGGNSMRPTRVPESEGPSNDGAGSGGTDDATASSGDSDDPDPSSAADPETPSDSDDDTPTDDTAEWEASGTDEATATGDSEDTRADGRERGEPRRERTPRQEPRGGGLLAWLKSLF